MWLSFVAYIAFFYQLTIADLEKPLEHSYPENTHMAINSQHPIPTWTVMFLNGRMNSRTGISTSCL